MRANRVSRVSCISRVGGTCAHSHAHMHVLTHIRPHVRTLTRSHAHTSAHTLTNSHMRSLACSCTLTRSLSAHHKRHVCHMPCTHACALSHTQAHTRCVGYVGCVSYYEPRSQWGSASCQPQAGCGRPVRMRPAGVPGPGPRMRARQLRLVRVRGHACMRACAHAGTPALSYFWGPPAACVMRTSLLSWGHRARRA